MTKYKEYLQSDFCRYGKGGPDRLTKSILKAIRGSQTASNPLAKICAKIKSARIRKKYGVEIGGESSIGKGLYLGHPFDITVNRNVTLGNNINLHKGVTIGRENRGKRKGYPTIGNEVYIGVNSTVVGNIRIGDDVLIAANTFVNCDVPDHSIVIGNPCIIKPKENATEGYINNRV